MTFIYIDLMLYMFILFQAAPKYIPTEIEFEMTNIP